MRKLKGVILAVVSVLFFMGCGELSKNDVAKVSFEKLSEKEEQILSLTENRVFFYKIKDISTSKGYKVNLNYEVYKDGKEVKNEAILTTANETYEEGRTEINLGINIKEGKKINCILGGDGVYSNHNYEAEEAFNEYSSVAFAGDYDLELPKEKRICIYYANSENSIESNITGMDMESERIKEIIKRNKESIFLSISVEDF
ncbi:hypothetical protein GNF80_12960 [Clostridium perfringens]|nr:hypothetical protein [Clostridium perfringens]